MIQLRPYQNEVIKRIKESNSNRQLVVLPTGTGKTIVFSELARQLDKPTLILAHRDELINQAVEKMRFVWPHANIGVVKGKRHEPNQQITVASVQSLHQRRLERMPTDYELIITDEAHHATAATYRRIYETMNPDLHVGVTATPNRTDKKLLGSIYDEVSFEADILDFIPEYLSDLQIIRRDSGIVLDGVARSANDLNCNDLSDALNTPEGNAFVVESWKEVASECQSTIVFCADIAHIHGVVNEFKLQGIKAVGIDSNMAIDMRRAALRLFFDGEAQVLVNCGILTEGFDCPQVDCILLVRPTRSELLLRQMIGRGTRLYPGKEKCKIVDIACVSNEWDLATPAELFGIEQIDEKRAISKQVTQQARMRKRWGDVDFSKVIAGVYDTRNPGKLHWQKIRWKGWLLRCGKDGDLKILPTSDEMKTLNRYDVEHETIQQIMKFGELENQKASYAVAENISLDMAFSVAESFVREHNFDMSLAQPDQRWHRHLATDKQKRYIRELGGGDMIKDKLTKIEASNVITFLRDQKEVMENGSDDTSYV